MSYEIIELEMEPDLQDKLVESYVLDNFNAASIDAFYNSYDSEEAKIEDQLYAAVLNEMIIKALEEEIKAHKEKDEEINKLIEKERELEKIYDGSSDK